jgi:predicted nucleic acid-binding protein
MPRVAFDTSVFIAHKPKTLPSGSLLSIVVVQELMAGARDASEIKEWEATAREFEKQGRLLVPNTEDWLMAGRVLNSLLRGLKSKLGGKTPKLRWEEKQRIIRDVLIVRSVKRAGAMLVTDNIDDFKKTGRFCNARVKSSKDFFDS